MKKTPSISYAVMCYNEYEETRRLLNILLNHKKPQDEIVVLFDDKGDPKLWTYLLELSDYLFLSRFKFKDDFAEWRNRLKKLCSKDYIFYLDADEYPHEYLLQNIHSILEANPKSDMFYVPRINTVENITQEDIERWGWSISKLETLVDEKELDLSKPDDLEEYKLLKKYGLIIEEN